MAGINERGEKFLRALHLSAEHEEIARIRNWDTTLPDAFVTLMRFVIYNRDARSMFRNQ
jgi:hypothetical protein